MIPEPTLEIQIQPVKCFRFRYKEGKSTHGHILGRNNNNTIPSTNRKGRRRICDTKYPTVKVSDVMVYLK